MTTYCIALPTWPSPILNGAIWSSRFQVHISSSSNNQQRLLAYARWCESYAHRPNVYDITCVNWSLSSSLLWGVLLHSWRRRRRSAAATPLPPPAMVMCFEMRWINSINGIMSTEFTLPVCLFVLGTTVNKLNLPPIGEKIHPNASSKYFCFYIWGSRLTWKDREQRDLMSLT